MLEFPIEKVLQWHQMENNSFLFFGYTLLCALQLYSLRIFPKFTINSAVTVFWNKLEVLTIGSNSHLRHP